MKEPRTYKEKLELEARQDQCSHPIADLSVDTHTIRNCPAENWPDEEVRVIRCKHCEGGIVATGTTDMLAFLLEHVKELSAEVKRLKERSV